jgi:hypothetical protein
VAWLLLQIVAGYGSNLPTAAATSAALTAGVVAAFIVVFCAHASQPAPSGVQRLNTSVHAHARRTAFLPQRDPDASGRTRPRAPGACRATA